MPMKCYVSYHFAKPCQILLYREALCGNPIGWEALQMVPSSMGMDREQEKCWGKKPWELHMGWRERKG